MSRVLQAKVIINEIREGKLLENARITGDYIMVFIF